MKRTVIAALAALCLTSSAWAYLPSFAELRRWWPQDRPVPSNLYLSYVSETGDHQTLDIFIRRDGLWAKRVRLEPDAAPKVTWKWGLDAWGEQGGRVRHGLRQEASWDDWLFEPNIEVLLQLMPQEWLKQRGLGRYDGDFMWLFGARHDGAEGEWLGLLGTPLRAAVWQSAKDSVGQVWFEYRGGHRYPDVIRFRRPGRSEYVLRKQDTVWNADPGAYQLVPPPQVRWIPEHQPQPPRADDADTGAEQ